MRDPLEHNHPDLLDEAQECLPTLHEIGPLRKPDVFCRRCRGVNEGWRLMCRWCGRSVSLLTRP